MLYNTNINQLKSKVIPILKEAGVTKSALFGSYVRGENKKNSDIDMLVELPEGKSLLDLVRFEIIGEAIRHLPDEF